MTPPRRSIALRGPARLETLPSLLDAVRELCDAADADPAMRHDLRLAVEEACVNVMRHAYSEDDPGEISLDVELSAWEGRPAIRVDIHDRGRPFDPLSLVTPQAGTDDVQALPLGGLGVHLMRQVTDVQTYSHATATGNHLTLVKFLATRKGETA